MHKKSFPNRNKRKLMKFQAYCLTSSQKFNINDSNRVKIMGSEI